MKRQKILIACILFFSSISHAQFSIGIKAGYSNNRLKTDISNRTFTENKNGSGLGFGILGRYKLNNRINIESSVELLQKKYSFERTGIYEGVFDLFSNSYFQIPLTVQYKLFEKEKIGMAIHSGMYGAYWVLAKQKGVIPNIFNSANSPDANSQGIQYLTLESYSEAKLFSKSRDQRLETGWVAGISAYYILSENYAVFARYEYYNSLSDQQKEYTFFQVPKYNRTGFASIGCFMNLIKKEPKSK